MNAMMSRKTKAPLVLHAETAEDVMAPNPISIRAEAGVPEAIVLFTEKGIAAAPVIDEAGRPIGVVSRSDLLIHQREQEKMHGARPEYFYAPSFESAETLRETKMLSRGTVADLMTPAVFAVAPDTPVERVIGDMLGLHVHRLFVVDGDGILVGVISTMDVLKHLQAEL
jgi:CBS domain-containing protein